MAVVQGDSAISLKTDPLVWLAVLLALILLLVVLFCQPAEAQPPDPEPVPDPYWQHRVFIVEVRR